MRHFRFGERPLYRVDDLPAGILTACKLCRLSDTRDASIQVLPEGGLDTLLQDLPNLSHVEIFLHQPPNIVNKHPPPYVLALSHSLGVFWDPSR